MSILKYSFKFRTATHEKGNLFGDTIEEFDGSRKRDFEKLVIERSNLDDFKLFGPFIAKVQELVAASGN